MTIEKIAILSDSILIIVLIFKIITMGRSAKALARDLAVSNEEKLYVTQALQKVIEEQNSQMLEKTDGFLKFVSESRDWAFSYIEDVQEKLTSFDDKIAEIVKYYSVYGPDMQGVHIDLLKQVSEAVEELKSVLPK